MAELVDDRDRVIDGYGRNACLLQGPIDATRLELRWQGTTSEPLAGRRARLRFWRRFAEAVRRQVPGGGELMNKTEEMIEIYGELREREGRQEGIQAGRQEGIQAGRQEGIQEGRQEGIQEGRQRGQLGTIEKFLQAGVEWSTIEAATGIDAAAFDQLKHQLDADDEPRIN